MPPLGYVRRGARHYGNGVGVMEHRGIRYTIRARIERDEWHVAIHPGDVEGTGKVVTGDHEKAEALAQSMIDNWLERHQWR